MDKVGKSIFMAKVTKAIKDDENLIFMTARVKAGVLSARGGKAEVRREVESITKRWRRRRKYVFVQLMQTEKGKECITSMLDTTAVWGRRKEEEFECR